MEAIDIVKSHYVKELAAKNMREDGRGQWDFRSLKISPDVIDHAEGSAQVELGNTKVLVGVKLQVDTPMKDTPEQGNLIVNSELLALAHAEFESGPPSPESIELARVVDRGIRAAGCVDLGKLFIEKDKVWSVFIDVYVLNHGGNLLDAASTAAMSALLNAKMPKFEDGAAVYTERKTPLEIASTLASTTFVKLGNTLFLDSSGPEEAAADARLTIATDGKTVRAMQKGLRGSYSAKEVENLVEVSFSKYEWLKGEMHKATRGD